jgi:hypothetical protein
MKPSIIHFIEFYILNLMYINVLDFSFIIELMYLRIR